MLELKAKNSGAVTTKKVSINVLNDFEDPVIEIISHSDGDIVEEITIFEVLATDDNQIDSVQFNVNDGGWRQMYSIRK